MQKNEVFASAIQRTQHFSMAMQWYVDKLSHDTNFQNEYYKIAQELASCTRTSSNTKQVIFIAVGKSSQVAQIAVSMLVSVGILARFIHPTEAFHGDLGAVGQGDIVVLISNNGRSSEILQLIPGLQDRGVLSFAMTSKEHSPLAKIVNHLLRIPALEEMCPLNQAPITSTITSLAFCQLLVASTVEIRQFPITDYAKNHPGGAIGKRIFLKIDDIMSCKTQLPKIQLHENFQNIISVFTRFSKAALLVTQEDNKFLGLITEKDLRKAMEKHGPSVFSLTAAAIMNQNPTTILFGTLAIDAAEKMLSHTPPFNVMPVVDANNFALGLLHMNDLILAGVI